MAKPDDNQEDVAFIAAIEAGKASLDGGRGVPYEDVRNWLLSWGSENELPAPHSHC